MEHIISILSQHIINFISTTGYFGVFVLMVLESALIPIPSEITMPFSGYLAATGRFNFAVVVFIGAFANLVGSILVYMLGHWGEHEFAHAFIRKYGRFLLISEHELHRSEKWFRDHGDKITFFSRVLPIVRTFISLPAGVARMDFKKFCIFTFFGSSLWSLFLTYVGFTLGKNWNALHPYYQKFEYAIVVICLAGGVYYVLHKFKSIKR
jgi:membrane protein DedA with SNARE-associated domain